MLPEPAFVCYNPIGQLTGAKVVVIPTTAESGFALDPDALEAAITERSKLLVLPSPNNPTGAVLAGADLRRVAEIAVKHDLIVLSDEIYAELTYEGEHVSIAAMPGMAERTIVVGGFSKSYAMTGWRLGYACGPQELIKVMTLIHQYAIMSAPTTAQYAAVEALEHGDEDIELMREEYNERRLLLVDGLNRLGLSCVPPKGAFYAFPSIKSTGLTSEQFCEKLLLEHGVAVIPGGAFGACGEGHVRCCYASSKEDLSEALRRIEEMLK